MKKAILLFIFLSGIVPCTAFPEEYSLDDLYRLAMQRSETIRIAEEDVFISERDKDRAMAVLFPKLSAFGSYTKYNKEKAIDLFVIQPDNSTAWGLNLKQSLSLSGKEFTALRIAKEYITKNGYDLGSVKGSYLLSVASTYYDVLRARKGVDIANTNVERLTRHRDASRTRLRVGEITKTVLLRAEAELSGAQSDLIKAENSLKLAKAVLARTAGINGDYDVKESDAGIQNAPLTFDFTAITGDCRLPVLNCLKQTALSERSEIKSAELEKEIAGQQITYTKGSYWPDVSVQGVYNRLENDPTLAPFEIKESVYGTIRIDYPFFEGGLRKAEVSQAKARFRQTDYKLEDANKSVSVEVENAYLNLITASGILEKLQAEAEYAADNYNAVTKQFEFGLADSLDVMDANTLLVTSEKQLANARYDYQYAILELKRATGTLLKSVISGQ